MSDGVLQDRIIFGQSWNSFYISVERFLYSSFSFSVCLEEGGARLEKDDVTDSQTCKCEAVEMFAYVFSTVNHMGPHDID